MIMNFIAGAIVFAIGALFGGALMLAGFQKVGDENGRKDKK